MKKTKFKEGDWVLIRSDVKSSYFLDTIGRIQGTEYSRMNDQYLVLTTCYGLMWYGAEQLKLLTELDRALYNL